LPRQQTSREPSDASTLKCERRVIDDVEKPPPWKVLLSCFASLVPESQSSSRAALFLLFQETGCSSDENTEHPLLIDLLYSTLTEDKANQITHFHTSRGRFFSVVCALPTTPRLQRHQCLFTWHPLLLPSARPCIVLDHAVRPQAETRDLVEADPVRFHLLRRPEGAMSSWRSTTTH